MEPIVCIFPLGLELLQGRNQDRLRFPEGGRKARVGRRGKGKARWTPAPWPPPDSECPKGRDRLC